MRLILILVSLILPLSLEAQNESRPDPPLQAQTLVSILEYIAVDYHAAVGNGEILNSDEYEEQREFAATVKSLLEDLSPQSQRDAFLDQASVLADLIENRADARTVADHCRSLAKGLIKTYGINTAPSVTPDPAAASSLYAIQCAGCHGSGGHGDGPIGVALDPPPSSFLDSERADQRSIYNLYTAINLGIPNTGMPSFSHLSSSERWELAFYVAGLGDDAASISQGKQLWESGVFSDAVPTLAELTTQSPDELKSGSNSIVPALAFLRHHPEVLNRPVSNPVERTKQELQRVLLAYGNSQPERALQSALTAYLDGFELVESQLSALDSELASGIERDMQVLRNLIRDRAPQAAIDDAITTLDARLDIVANLIEERGSSPTMLFVSALLILLREGLEAILVVASMALYLRRTERPCGLRYLHFGWFAALVVGVLTWLGIKSVINLSGAQREVIEGVAAMLAAFVLLYVGIWMHSQGRTMRWQSFLKERLGRTLSAGALWGIAGLSFVAVYREILEIALFYEALWLQSAQTTPLILGATTAGLGLSLLGWLVVRMGARLPLRQFFQINGALMFGLSVVFTGKGVGALQEAGWMTTTFVKFPKVDWLGLYPTVQSLGLQLAVVAVGAVWLYSNSPRHPEPKATES